MDNRFSNLIFRLCIIVVFALLAANVTNAQCTDSGCIYDPVGICFFCGDSPGSNCQAKGCASSCLQIGCGNSLRKRGSPVVPSGQLEALPGTSECSNTSSVVLAELASKSRKGTIIGLFTPTLRAAPLLISASFGNSDFFQKGVLLNRNTKTIIGYRIGWVYGYQDKAALIKVSTWRSVAQQIKSDETATVSKLHISIAPTKDGARLVQFFVAEVRFSDGTLWKQPLGEIREIGAVVQTTQSSFSLRDSPLMGQD